MDTLKTKSTISNHVVFNFVSILCTSTWRTYTLILSLYLLVNILSQRSIPVVRRDLVPLMCDVSALLLRQFTTICAWHSLCPATWPPWFAGCVTRPEPVVQHAEYLSDITFKRITAFRTKHSDIGHLRPLLFNHFYEATFCFNRSSTWSIGFKSRLFAGHLRFCTLFATSITRINLCYGSLNGYTCEFSCEHENALLWVFFCHS